MRQGSPATTFEDVVRPVADRLFRTALLLSGEWAQAEDLVQSVLAKFYARGRWHQVDHPEAYLRRMVTNEFLSLRRRRSASELTVEEVPEPAFGHWVEPDSALRMDLFRGLAQLPPPDRAVVVLRFWDDLSVTETAAVLGCTPGAVRTRSSRALVKLRLLLDPPVGPNEPTAMALVVGAPTTAGKERL